MSSSELQVQQGQYKPTRRFAGLRTLRARRMVLGYLLVAPVVLWRLATSIYPFVYTSYLSFFDQSPVRRAFDFIGLDNYVAMTRDANIRDSLGFTVYFTIISVSLQVVFGLATAQLLNQRFFSAIRRGDQLVALGDVGHRRGHGGSLGL